MNVLRRYKLLLSIALALVVVSWLAVAILGIRPGIDFTGGTEWHITISDVSVVPADLESFFDSELNIGVVVKYLGERGMLIRLPNITEAQHQEYLLALNETYGIVHEQSFASVGPVIGKELRQKSLWAVVGVLLGISLYTSWAFRKVSRPIRSWKYGVVALLTLLHDVSIPLGVFAVFGYVSGVEIDTTFIVALLVVMGFSVHDTIVVFDRIRENILESYHKKASLREIINRSINETIMRSVNTSLTLLFILGMMLAIGPPTLFYFILTVFIGTVVGTYSSLFVASPLLYAWGKDR